MLEIREIKSLPGAYARSDGYIKFPNDLRETKFRKGCIAYSSKGASHKYLNVVHRRFGTFKVHQLVCEAFHGEKPTEKSVVSHKNEDATDNRPENLCWSTQKENLNMPKFIEYCKNRTGDNSPCIKGRKK